MSSRLGKGSHRTQHCIDCSRHSFFATSFLLELWQHKYPLNFSSKYQPLTIYFLSFLSYCPSNCVTWPIHLPLGFLFTAFSYFPSISFTITGLHPLVNHVSSLHSNSLHSNSLPSFASRWPTCSRFQFCHVLLISLFLLADYCYRN
jgi:hypothetical protein